MTNKFPAWVNDLLIAFLSSMVVSVVIALFSMGAFLTGWLAAVLISVVAIFLLIRLWRKLGSSRTLMTLMLVTFTLRLAVGVFLYACLPSMGYADNSATLSGFVYSDAYNRDLAAFKLAQSGDSLITAFTRPDISDQYGGLLFLSAFISRVLSPDASRPLLISLLAMFAMTAGVAFLWSAAQKRWSAQIAAYAAWAFALFPDSVLLGSSQMREPFIIGLGCLAFWAILDWQEKPLRSGLIAALALAVTCLFSVPGGGVYAVILAAIVLVEWTLLQKNFSRRYFGFILLVMLSIITVLAGWLWLRQTLYYDAYVTRISSGWITKLLEAYGTKWTIPFTTIYGLTQPLLPAAIFEPSLPLWTTIAIIRSLAWWCVVPFLLYGLTSTWKADQKKPVLLFHILSIIFATWILISSARAGGDLWDNPRYRYMLIPFMSIVIAWACSYYKEHHSPWFWRWVAVVAEFLLFFTNFYLNRYVLGVGTQLPFNLMIMLIVAIAVLILGGGWIFDLLIQRKQLKKG